MKKILPILAVILCSVTFYDASAQTYNGAFYEMFFGRQPGARAEAMGRGLASVTGDANSYFYNPAGMASLEGLNLSGSFAGPYYGIDNYKFDNAYYDFFGASYNIKKYGTVGLSYDYFSYGLEEKIYRTDEFGNLIETGTFDPDVTNYRLTYSLEVIKDLFVGASLNVLSPNLIPQETSILVANEKRYEDENVFYFDIGAIKSFNIKSKNLNHNFNLGTSIINVNSADYSPVDSNHSNKLPVIFRLGAAYDLSVEGKSIISKLNSYNFLLNLEYEDLFNSKHFGGFHGGFEFTFLEILSLRAGYYSQDVVDYIDTTYGTNIGVGNIDKTISEFTYGFGINIPIRQLTNGKTPIDIKFDFTGLKQPSYIDNEDSPGNYYNYTIKFNWVF